MLGRLTSIVRRAVSGGSVRMSNAARRFAPIVAAPALRLMASPSRAVGVTVATAALSAAAFSTQVASTAGAVPARGKPQVIFVLGGPGAGKGTQCTMMAEKYGFIHLSAGDLLRAERKSGSADAELIQSYIAEGKIVPVEITVNLIKKAMVKSGASLFLIDGFPRNFDNLQGWASVMGDDVEVKFVLFYDTSEEVMERRLLSRGKTSGRTDDNAAVIKKRFNTYLQSTMPVVEVFAKDGRVRRVPSTSSVAEVFEETQRVVEPVVKEHLLALNQRLLEAISGGDSETYMELTSADMTAFEPETNFNLIKGLEFHNTYLNAALPPGSPKVKNFMSGSNVQLLGKTAVVTTTRLVQSVQHTATAAETRVWHRGDDNKWRMVHFHRSPTH